MNTLTIVSCTAAVLAVAPLSLTGVAAAAPSGPESANDVVQSLKALGYNVMINGAVDAPLSDCNVTDVHNPDSTGRAVGFTTVYVDVDCPHTSN